MRRNLHRSGVCPVFCGCILSPRHARRLKRPEIAEVMNCAGLYCEGGALRVSLYPMAGTQQHLQQL